MFQRAITLQQMADIFDDAALTGAIRTAPLWVMTAEHPSLGAFVTLQDHDPEGVILHSQFPLDMPLPAHQMPTDGN